MRLASLIKAKRKLFLVDFLTNLIDLTVVPSSTFILALSQHSAVTSAPEIRPDSIQDLSSLLDILELYPSLRLPINFLAEYLNPIFPRFYSLSTSPFRQFSSRIGISFSITGSCTRWLANPKSQYKSIPIFLHRSDSFALKHNSELPLVLISNGIGGPVPTLNLRVLILVDFDSLKALESPRSTDCSRPSR